MEANFTPTVMNSPDRPPGPWTDIILFWIAISVSSWIRPWSIPTKRLRNKKFIFGCHEMATDASIKSRRSKTKVAVIEPWCTGCSGVPVCTVYCKKNALRLVKDEETYPFQMMTVNRTLCIGCGACVAKGNEGIMLSGCPWDAIRMDQRLA